MWRMRWCLETYRKVVISPRKASITAAHIFFNSTQKLPGRKFRTCIYQAKQETKRIKTVDLGFGENFSVDAPKDENQTDLDSQSLTHFKGATFVVSACLDHALNQVRLTPSNAICHNLI